MSSSTISIRAKSSSSCAGGRRACVPDPHGEACPAALRVVRRLDGPPVHLHDAVADREPETRALAHLLRREKRREHLRQVLLRECRGRCPEIVTVNSPSAVLRRHADGRRRPAWPPPRSSTGCRTPGGAARRPPSAVRGRDRGGTLHGISRLVKLPASSSAALVTSALMSVGARSTFSSRAKFRIPRTMPRVRSASAMIRSTSSRPREASRQLLLQQVRVHEHHAEGIVDLVRDARRHLAHGGELLRLDEPRLVVREVLHRRSRPGRSGTGGTSPPRPCPGTPPWPSAGRTGSRRRRSSARPRGCSSPSGRGSCGSPPRGHPPLRGRWAWNVVERSTARSSRVAARPTPPRPGQPARACLHVAHHVLLALEERQVVHHHGPADAAFAEEEVEQAVVHRLSVFTRWERTRRMSMTLSAPSTT